MISIYDKRAKLEKLKEVQEDIIELELEKQSMLAVKQSAKAVSYDDMPHGNNQSDLSDFMVKMDNIICKIADKEDEKDQLERKYADAIYRTVKDENERTVLLKRYIELEISIEKGENAFVETVNYISWKEIAKMIGKSLSQTYVIHRHALQHLVL